MSRVSINTVKSTSGSPSESVLYTNAAPTPSTLGGIAAGTTFENRTMQQMWDNFLYPYQAPSFSSFSISGVSSPVEVGTTISGSKTFLWTTGNPSNINTNSIAIKDVTGVATLGTGLANDGTEALSVGTVVKNSELSNVWSIEATNSNSVVFSRNLTISWSYLQFYGVVDSNPTDSSAVRGLPSYRFKSAGSNFIFNTGNVKTKFAVCIPATQSIVSVIDFDSLNADITAGYVLASTFNVLDAGGNNVSYKIYVCTIGAPYTISHRHSITIS